MRAHLRLLAPLMLFALLMVAAIGMIGSAPAAAAPAQEAGHAPLLQACDPSGSTNGTADPTTITPGGIITFTGIGFNPGENVSFWLTAPGGDVLGTAEPLCCAAPDGRVRIQIGPPLTIIMAVEPGRWAMTIQGDSSQHTAVIYFCLVTQIQPTATPVPPTATTAPPTATAPPATATSVPATATSVPASPTTAVETPTTVAASPTVAAETPTTAPTVAASPTSPPAPPTLIPTLEPTATTVVVEPTPEPLPTEIVPSPAPTIVGMPRTGQGDYGMLWILLATAAGLVSLGLLATRSRPRNLRR